MSLALIGCKPHEVAQASPQAMDARADKGRSPYFEGLARTIRSADRVVVTEHSDKMDFYTGDEKEPTDAQITYRSLALDAQQRADFAARMLALAPDVQDAVPACIPEVHHTITFYKQGEPTHQMRVCFQCGQIEWDGTGTFPPPSIYAGLADFVTSLGMQPKRDWYALAQASKKH